MFVDSKAGGQTLPLERIWVTPTRISRLRDNNIQTSFSSKKKSVGTYLKLRRHAGTHTQDLSPTHNHNISTTKSSKLDPSHLRWISYKKSRQKSWRGERQTSHNQIKKEMASSSGGARSSTASHFASNFINITAGEAENEFYGIPLSNDITVAPPLELFGVILLVVAVVAKPYVGFLSNRKDVSISFWIAAACATYILRQWTLLPMLTSIIYTRTTYPYLVVIPHCIVANAAYRTERVAAIQNNNNNNKKTTSDGTNNDTTTTSHNDLHYLSSFVLGFFCYGFGGSIVSDVLMGLPATALGHARIIPCHIVGWLLVWFTPYDILYKLYTNKNSAVYHFLTIWEAIDTVTTPMGRVSRSARELKNKVTAPIVAGLLAGTGGATLRYADRIIVQGGGNHSDPTLMKTSRNAFELGFWKTLYYATLWWYLVVYRCNYGDIITIGNGGEIDKQFQHCREHNGSDLSRVVIVGLHVLWGILCEVGWASSHPVIWVVKKFVHYVGKPIARSLRLGPQENWPSGWKGTEIDIDNELQTTTTIAQKKTEKKD